MLPPKVTKQQPVPMTSRAAADAQASSSRRAFPVVVLLLLFCSFVAIDRLCIYQQPLRIDTAAYAVISHELLEGRALYTDVWDHKPPAIYMTYMLAESLVGYNLHIFYLLEVVATCATLFGVYYAASAHNRNGWLALWAALLWAVMSGDLRLEGTDPSVEVFMNACLAWAFALWVRVDKETTPLRYFAVIGALIALASLYKPVVVALPALLGITHIALAGHGIQAKLRALKQVAVIATVGVAAWLLTFGYFAATNRFGAFYETFTYNRHYAGNMSRNLLAPLYGKAELFPDVLNPLVLTICIGVCVGVFKELRSWALLVAYCLATWIAIALAQQFWGHYYQLWLPVLVIGVGWTLNLLGSLVQRQPRLRWAPHAAGALVLLASAVGQIPRYEAILTGDWQHASAPEGLAARPVAKRIDALLAPNETFYVWGVSPSLYVYSQRRPPAGVLYTHHLTDGPLAKRLSADVTADLARNQPEVFVIAHKERTTTPSHPLLESFYSQYAPLEMGTGDQTYGVFVRRGSKLEARLKTERARSE